MRVAMARWVCQDVTTNLARIEDEVVTAAAAGARWIVFPESFLHGYRRTVEPDRVRARFTELSTRYPAMAMFFGSFSEAHRNRMTVWRAGRELARYDKVHLFAPNDEDALWDEGDRYAAVVLDGWRVGLLNCNDLRFPEQARALRLDAGCDLLLAVAWWPWRRDHVWRTLLRARAIENGVFALGCCVAASEWPDERFAGAGNHVFDPHGDPVRTLDDRTWEIERERLAGLIGDPERGHRNIARVEVFEDGAAT